MLLLFNIIEYAEYILQEILVLQALSESIRIYFSRVWLRAI